MKGSKAMTDNKKLRRRWMGRRVRLSPEGAITLERGSRMLQRAVARALGAGADSVEIDVSRVRLIDAAGLGALVACEQMALQAGCQFRLEGAREKARALLALTGLDQTLLPGKGPGGPGHRRLRVA
jgi:anti-anti-sigma factor